MADIDKVLTRQIATKMATCIGRCRTFLIDCDYKTEKIRKAESNDRTFYFALQRLPFKHTLHQNYCNMIME